MICILVFACVLFRQGETSQGTSEEKKTRMIFDIKWHGWNQKWCSPSGMFLLRILFLIQLWAFLKGVEKPSLEHIVVL